MDNKISGPLSTLRWVDRGSVKPNDYNPNKVSKQNLELLKQSTLMLRPKIPIHVREQLQKRRLVILFSAPLFILLSGCGISPEHLTVPNQMITEKRGAGELTIRFLALCQRSDG